MEITKDWQEIEKLNTKSKKAVCPFCRDKRTNPTSSPSLSIDWKNGRAMCHYCNKVIFREAKSSSFNKQTEKNYSRPEPKGNSDISIKLQKWFFDRGISLDTLIKLKITEGQEMFLHLDKKQHNCIMFNYYLKDELVNIKFRDGAKNFKMVANAHIIPYNINSVIDNPDEELIFITEGEIDTLTLVELGYKCVISAPNGANSNLDWLDDFYYLFENKNIVLCTDMDVAGIKLHKELIRRFGPENVYEVDYFGYKDINDLYVGLGKDSCIECINKKKRPKVDGIFEVNDIINEINSLYEHGLQKGFTLGFHNFDKLISFEVKRLCIITGIPGAGKSEFLDEIIVKLNYRYGLKAAYFSPENLPISLHFAKIYEKIYGKKFSKIISPTINSDVVNYINDNFFFVNPATYTINNILSSFKYLVRSRGIKLCVIDPYNRVDWDNESYKGLSETQIVSRVLDNIQNFAVQNDVLFIIVAHPTKMRRLDNGQMTIPTLYDINGSANFFNKTDFGLTIHRDRLKGIVEAHIQKVKFKHLGEPGMAQFIYNYNNGRYHEWHEHFNINNDFDNSCYLKNEIEEVNINNNVYFDNDDNKNDIYNFPY